MHKKIIPAVWFQNQQTPAPESPPKPKVLQLMESQLGAIVGGIIPVDSTTYADKQPSDTSDN